MAAALPISRQTRTCSAGSSSASSGQRYADLMSELLWQPIGAADSAYITVDRLGAPRAAGGMCTTTRDLARVGQMMVEGGTHRGRQVVPEAWIETITHDGDSEAWDSGHARQLLPRHSDALPCQVVRRAHVPRRCSSASAFTVKICSSILETPSWSRSSPVSRSR